MIDPAQALSGFAVGAIVGLTGVGGGSLMTPLLVLLFGIHPATAVGTDLLHAAITKAGGTYVHAKQGRVDWRITGLLAAGSLPAAVATLWTLHAVTGGLGGSKIITITLGVALLLTAGVLVLRSCLRRWSKTHGTEAARHPALTVLTGVVLGFLVSVSSVGAGALGVTALFFLYPRSNAARIVASDLAHAVPLTLVAGCGHWLFGRSIGRCSARSSWDRSRDLHRQSIRRPHTGCGASDSAGGDVGLGGNEADRVLEDLYCAGMKFQQLRYLVAVHENGLNITAAARQLHTSQPGVSRQLKLLEEELGFQLFEREGRALTRTTAAGEEIISRAGSILREMQNIRRTSAELRKADGGTLSIATTHTQARYVLPRSFASSASSTPRCDCICIRAPRSRSPRWSPATGWICDRHGLRGAIPASRALFRYIGGIAPSSCRAGIPWPRPAN